MRSPPEKTIPLSEFPVFLRREKISGNDLKRRSASGSPLLPDPRGISVSAKPAADSPAGDSESFTEQDHGGRPAGFQRKTANGGDGNQRKSPLFLPRSGTGDSRKNKGLSCRRRTQFHSDSSAVPQETPPRRGNGTWKRLLLCGFRHKRGTAFDRHRARCRTRPAKSRRPVERRFH